MRCLLIGHLVIDVILKGSKSELRIGGGVYYSSMTLARFCDVEVLTSLGEDFPSEWLDELRKKGVRLRIIPSEESTRYELRYLDANRRRLRLLSRASPITEFPSGKYDMVLLNPVANEIPGEAVERLRRTTDFLAADVQGFIRAPETGEVRLQRVDASFLRDLKVVHADVSEMGYLENIGTEEVEVFLASNGPEEGLAYLRGRPYSYRPARVEVEESTGAGDVFLASFSYFYTHCPFIQALKRANAFTALFLKYRKFDFPMEEVNELANSVRVERLTI